MSHKHYTNEFKKQIVILYHASTPTMKLAAEYDLIEQTIYKCIKQYTPSIPTKNGTSISMKD